MSYSICLGLNIIQALSGTKVAIIYDLQAKERKKEMREGKKKHTGGRGRDGSCAGGSYPKRVNVGFLTFCISAYSSEVSFL